MDLERFDLNKYYSIDGISKEMENIPSLIQQLETEQPSVPILNRLARLYWLAGKSNVGTPLLNLARSLDPENPILQENAKILQRYSWHNPIVADNQSELLRIYKMAKLAKGHVLCFGNISQFFPVIPFFEQFTLVDFDISRLREGNDKIIDWFGYKSWMIRAGVPLPFKDNSFDTLIGSGSWFMQDLSYTFKELSRICSPGGFIIIDINQLCLSPDRFITKDMVKDAVKEVFRSDLKVDDVTGKGSSIPHFHLILMVENKKPGGQRSRFLRKSTHLIKADKTVSVIIPTYNRAHLLPRAIESVLTQSYQAIEIIVVDDGSTDHTETVVAGYGDRVRYLKLPHTGISPTRNGISIARNAGVRQASGQYLAFLDDDDMLLPWGIEVRVRYLENHPKCDMVCTCSIVLERDGHEAKEFYVVPHAFESSPLKYIMIDRKDFPVHTQLLRAEVFSKVGLFNEELLSEDAEFNFRLARHSTIGLLPIFTALYFSSGGGGLKTTTEILHLFKNFLVKAYETPLEDLFPEIKGFSPSTPQYIKALLKRAERMAYGAAFAEALQDIGAALAIARSISPEAESLVVEFIQKLAKSMDLSLSLDEEYLEFFLELKTILSPPAVSIPLSHAGQGGLEFNQTL